MIKAHSVLSVVILITVFSTKCHSQNNITITEPIIQFKSNNITVYYDIENSTPGDEFNVWMDVTDSAGNYIMPEALEGDIGENIEGGRRRKVVWNLTKDSVYMDAIIFVQVHAEMTKKAEPEVVYVQQPGVSPMQPMYIPKKKTYFGKSKGMLMLKSAVFPGWGLTEVKQKPHWIKGVVAYGLLGGTIYQWVGMEDSFSNYEESVNIDERNSYYEDWQGEAKFYNGLVAATVSVWAVDLLWMAFTKSNRQSLIDAQGFSIQPSYQPVVKAPMLTLNYKF